MRTTIVKKTVGSHGMQVTGLQMAYLNNCLKITCILLKSLSKNVVADPKESGNWVIESMCGDIIDGRVSAAVNLSPTTVIYNVKLSYLFNIQKPLVMWGQSWNRKVIRS
jgi:hypothetical protein